MKQIWKERIAEQLEIAKRLMEEEETLETVERVAQLITDAYRKGLKLLICGNGGSAADSQHIATELVSKFLVDRKALDAEALSVNTSTLTAIGNDYNFDTVFARQIEAKGKMGDVLLAISTSGNSRNVIEAIKAAKNVGMITVGLTGNNQDSRIYKEADHCIGVPSTSTPRIQEAHILIGHMICEYIELQLFGREER
jgi:D-sedoheptulose 7-phosphate isomerase